MAEELPPRFLRHDDVAARLGGVDTREVMDEIKSGEFGRRVIRRKKFFLVPEEDFNSYVRARRVFPEKC
jgi:hypothetical protein